MWRVADEILGTIWRAVMADLIGFLISTHAPHDTRPPSTCSPLMYCLRAATPAYSAIALSRLLPAGGD